MKRKYQRLCALLLACAMMLGMVPAVTAGDEPTPPDHVIVNQVYGGGSNGNASHSFIELYNPTAEEVDLSAWSIQYRSSDSGNQKAAWLKLDLTGTIQSEGYYLIRCGATTGTDFSVPEGNQEWNIQLHNKGLSVALVSNQNLLEDSVQDDVTALGDTGIVDLAAVQGNDGDADQVPYAYETSYADLQSKKKAIRRVDFADTDNNAADFEAVDYSKPVSEDKQPHAGETATDPGTPDVPDVPEEPTYTPVEAGDTRVTGYYNESGALQLELAGRYNSGAMNADGGSLEIVQYNPVNGFAYAVSGVKGKLIAVDLSGSLEAETVVPLPGTEYDLKTVVSAKGFTYGDMTSVAISPDGTKLAVAIQAEGYADAGLVALFACGTDGALTLLSTATVGVQPDMVTFANESTILTADEGEPRGGASGTDPKGSVSIVTIGADNALTANTVTFDSFDDQRNELTAAGVLIQKGCNPSTDFEPEYIAVSGGTAYVSLQEANAIAVLDIPSAAFTGVYPLGFQDYSVTKVDLQKNDTIELQNYENVYGIKMPDGISVTTIGGKTYLLTANEGDSRADWKGLNNEYEDKTSPTGNVTLDKKVVWFNADMWDGLDNSKAYVFGGRSFSIYEVTANGLNLVYDSGSGFEEVTAKQLPDYFNASNDKTSLDNRSGKKGPEPETVTVGAVDGKTYAFIALERIGGVMVYDISDPANTSFVNYINSREFDDAIQGDVSPEGLCFVSATDSKTEKALLLAACEVSGTLAVYELTPKETPTEPTEPEPTEPSEPSTPTVPVVPSYRVSLPDGLTGGTVTLGSTYAPSGSTVTITVTPDEGYELKSLTVTDAKGNALALTELGGGKYSFRMPASKVTVTAEFTEAAKPVRNPFADVFVDDYYYDAILWAVANGITEGASETVFSPGTLCTRAQIVTFLWRAAGQPAPRTNDMPFTDVSKSDYYYDAVQWAVEQGITQGTSETTFSPDATCTRSQAVTFLWRAQSSPTAGAASSFDDVEAGAYYAGAVSWAVAGGITVGTGTNTFSPNDNCTRAQIVTFLYRAAAV